MPLWPFFFLLFTFLGKSLCPPPPPHFSAPSYATVTIADQLRMVSWSNYCHLTVVKPVYGHLPKARVESCSAAVCGRDVSRTLGQRRSMVYGIPTFQLTGLFCLNHRSNLTYKKFFRKFSLDFPNLASQANPYASVTIATYRLTRLAGIGKSIKEKLQNPKLHACYLM